MHMLIGLVMYSNSNILSSEITITITDWMSNLNVLKNEVKLIEQRFNTTHSQLYLAFVIIVILVVLFSSIILDLIAKRLFKIICC